MFIHFHSVLQADLNI